MDFESKPADVSVAAMEKEVDDLMRPAGITLDWRLAGTDQGKESFYRLVVLKFKGRCRVEWPAVAGGSTSLKAAETLGSTSIVDGRVIPYSEVECDAVRKALAYLGPGAGRQERLSALGLALGRVVAHELYHILARTAAHNRQGLAKESQSLGDLVSADGPAFLMEDSRAMSGGRLPAGR